MAKSIRPADVASQHKWDINALLDFCAKVLEDANAHNIAFVLWSIEMGAWSLARNFVDLEMRQTVAGELTPELAEERQALLNEFKAVAEMQGRA
jgi:hypothetical protein